MKNISYKETCEKHPEVKNVINERMWEYMSGCNERTGDIMNKTWLRNAELNLKKLYPKHKSLTNSFFSFGKNKALIGVGAGPSLNNNIDHLKEVFDFNLRYKLEEQPFIIATSNHQYKPLLKKGIVPNFVFLTDGGDHIYDQLCKDIPHKGSATVLVASICADHRTVKNWAKQGRYVCFVIPCTKSCQDLFKEIIKEDPKPFTSGGGGNVLNSIFVTGLQIFKTRFFMFVGNDLSFPYDPNLKKRREMFYADGDYSVNIKKGADEAKDKFIWTGYKTRDNPFQPNEKIIEFAPVGTSRQLYLYKMWIELHVTTWGCNTECDPFIYYNCSESGIAGVLARDNNAMDDPHNWYLLDEIVPKRWRTRTFLQAVNQYLEASLICNEKDVGDVILSPRAMAGARTAAHVM